MLFDSKEFWSEERYKYFVEDQRRKYHAGRDTYADLLLSSFAPQYWVNDLDLQKSYLSSDGSLSVLDAIADSFSRKKSDDPVDALLGAKRDWLGRSVEDVLGLIYEREQIKYGQFSKIDKEWCKVKEPLFMVDQIHPGLNPNVDRLRNNIQKELAALEHEKRAEEVACWRDVARLRGELREVMRYWSMEKQRGNFLSDDKATWSGVPLQ